MNVLILDDEPWNVSWIEDFVSAKGGTCHFARTYQEAVEYCDKIAPDIAIVDIMIGATHEPIKGATLSKFPSNWVGLQFLRHLRSEKRYNAKTTKVLVYSVLDKEDLERTIRDSFQGIYCTKNNVPDFRSELKKAMGSVKTRE